MAAFATVSANGVWNTVNTRLADANPVHQAAFKRLKSYLAQQKGNPDLQLLSFTAADAAAAGGTVLGSGVKKIYGVYLKKAATATQNTVKLYDDATDDTTAANAIAAFDFRIASEEACWIDSNGKVLATGIVVTAHTTLLGTTDGSSANAAGGFVLIG